jgi:hypothetical protein
VVSWLTDLDFQIRGALAMNPSDGSTILRVRDTAQEGFRDLITWPMEEEGAPVAFCEDGRSLYVKVSLPCYKHTVRLRHWGVLCVEALVICLEYRWLTSRFAALRQSALFCFESSSTCVEVCRFASERVVLRRVLSVRVEACRLHRSSAVCIQFVDLVN